jgi:hypothetical protein
MLCNMIGRARGVYSYRSPLLCKVGLVCIYIYTGQEMDLIAVCKHARIGCLRVCMCACVHASNSAAGRSINSISNINLGTVFALPISIMDIPLERTKKMANKRVIQKASNNKRSTRKCAPYVSVCLFLCFPAVTTHCVCIFTAQ